MVERALGVEQDPGAATADDVVDAAQSNPTTGEKSSGRAEWTFARLDDPFARLMAIVELPWFVQWWRGLSDGKIDCLHCGRPCDEQKVEMIGAVRVDRDQLITVSICASCYRRSATFEDAGRAAVEAAEAGFLSGGRSFAHGVAAPEAAQ